MEIRPCRQTVADALYIDLQRSDRVAVALDDVFIEAGFRNRAGRKP